MKLNEERFTNLCAEVISDLMKDDDLNGDSKVMVMLISTIILRKITGKLFSEDKEIEIVSNSSGCEDK